MFENDTIRRDLPDYGPFRQSRGLFVLAHIYEYKAICRNRAVDVDVKMKFAELQNSPGTKFVQCLRTVGNRGPRYHGRACLRCRSRNDFRLRRQTCWRSVLRLLCCGRYLRHHDGQIIELLHTSVRFFRYVCGGGG